MKKVSKSNQKQIDWTLNAAKQILTQYIDKDLKSNEVWKSIMDDCNNIVRKTHDDCLTEHIVFAICQYLEDIEKSERPDNPVLAEQKGFVQEHTGFKQEKPRGFTVGR